MARTRKEIDQDYTNLCVEVGEKQFKIKLLEREIRLAQSKQGKLNREALALMAAAQELVNGTSDVNGSN